MKWISIIFLTCTFFQKLRVKDLWKYMYFWLISQNVLSTYKSNWILILHSMYDPVYLWYILSILNQFLSYFLIGLRYWLCTFSRNIFWNYKYKLVGNFLNSYKSIVPLKIIYIRVYTTTRRPYIKILSLAVDTHKLNIYLSG